MLLLFAAAFACNRSVATSATLPPAPRRVMISAQGSQTVTSSPFVPATDTLTPSPTVTNTATTMPTRTPSPTPSLPPTPTRVIHPPGEVAVPILLYHHVTDRVGYKRYAVTIVNFKEQMQYLADQGYQTITLSELADVIQNGGYLPDKPVVITFDDGCLDVYVNAFPILQQLNYRATMYIITGTLGTDKSYGYVQTDQINELIQAGWEIGSHSISHTNLNTSIYGIGNELEQSKQTLEDQFHITVQSFSYPFASANNGIVQLVKDKGYTNAVGVGILNLHSEKTLFFLSRREIYDTYRMADFKDLLTLPPASTATPENTATLTGEPILSASPTLRSTPVPGALDPFLR